MWAKAFAMCFLYTPLPLPEVVAEEINLFPSAWTAAEAVFMADQHIAWLRERVENVKLSEREAYQDWLKEATARWDVWDDLERAHRFKEDSPGACKSFLETIRRKIGHARYYAGRMPHPLPVWRFSEP